jgi:hypothetical protein
MGWNENVVLGLLWMIGFSHVAMRGRHSHLLW